MKMKTKALYHYNKTVYTLAQLMMVMFSVLMLALLYMAKLQAQLGFMQLVQTDITINIIYLMAMFGAICFFELHFYGGKLKKSESVEVSILGILLIAISQLALLNLLVSGLLFYFIYRFLKQNDLKLKNIYRKVKENRELKLIVLNLILFVFTISMIYIMIRYRIAK